MRNNWFGFIMVLLSFNALATVAYNDFSSVSGLKLNGGAAVVSTTDGQVLRLTKAARDQAGSAFSLATVNAGNFSTYFTFRITSPGGTIFDCNTEAGADGLVFVVQPVDSSLGGLGQGIGYDGIPRSIGVEFDTWCNAANKDPNSNHIGIVTNGSVVHADTSSTLVVTPNFDNGSVWHVWIDYNASVLEVRANQTGVRPASAMLSKTMDIPTLLTGTSTTQVTNAYIGFTSGTGADWGNHDILTWIYREDYQPIDASNCLLNWAEDNYPSLFAPSRPTSQTYGNYILRTYSQSGTYLALSSDPNGRVYYYKPAAGNNALLDLGLISTWKTQAGCSQ